MEIKICGKYIIYVSDDLVARYQAGEFNDDCEPFISHIVNPKLMRQMALFTWCWEKLVRDIKSKSGIDRVVELFGGIGRSTVIIQNELEPCEHVVYDISDVMVEHLSQLFGWRQAIHVGKLDSLQALVDGMKLDADFVSFDINHFTIRSLYKEQTITDALRQVFASTPSFVELTDLALPYLHLNKKLYSQLSGCGVDDFSDYIYALSQIIESRWGYGITFVAHHSNVAAILLEPAEYIPSVIEIVDARDYAGTLDYWKVLK